MDNIKYEEFLRMVWALESIAKSLECLSHRGYETTYHENHECTTTERKEDHTCTTMRG